MLLLYKGETEIPSDITGVVYVQWQHSIREVDGKIQQALRGCGLIA